VHAHSLSLYLLSERADILYSPYFYSTPECTLYYLELYFPCAIHRPENEVKDDTSCCTLIKNKNLIFLIYNEIQNGAVVKSYMANTLLIYGEIFAHFLIYWEALPHTVYDFATAPL
jgi:hypothetical protein